MWNRFKTWMATDKAGAIVNVVGAATWGTLATTMDSLALRGVVTFNALVFAVLAGMKLDSHFTRPLIDLWRSACDSQNELIMDLLTERQQLLEAYDTLETDTAPELADDQGLS